MSSTKLVFFSSKEAVHGVDVITKAVKKVFSNNPSFSIKEYPIGHSKSQYEIGQINNVKIKTLVLSMIRYLFSTNKIKTLVYFPLSIKTGIEKSSNLPLLRDFILIFLSKIKGYSLIVHIHSNNLAKVYTDSNIIIKIIYNFIFSYSHRVFFLSNKIYKKSKKIVRQEKVIIINNGITKNSVNLKSYNNKIKCITFMANFWKDKGPLEMMQTAKKIISIDKNVKFVLAGNWPDKKVKKVFYDFIKKEKLNSFFHILGYVEGRQKKKLFELTDIFFYPSYNDAQPIVIIEALSYSLPIIATDVGSISDLVIHNSNGFICKPKNISEFSTGILRLCRSNSLLKNMSEKSRLHFENNFTESQFQEEIKSVFKSCII